MVGPLENEGIHGKFKEEMKIAEKLHYRRHRTDIYASGRKPIQEKRC